MLQFKNNTAYHLTSDQAVRLGELSASRPNATDRELVSRVIEMGLYQMEYRAKRNKAQAEEKKLGREALRLINSGKLSPDATRELGEALGITG